MKTEIINLSMSGPTDRVWVFGSAIADNYSLIRIEIDLCNITARMTASEMDALAEQLRIEAKRLRDIEDEKLNDRIEAHEKQQP